MVRRTVKVKNRKLEIRAPANMPDGTTVRVYFEVVSQKPNGKSSVARVGGLNDQEDPLLWMARHAIPSGLTDRAAEHDHYIYGSPKRSSKAKRD